MADIVWTPSQRQAITTVGRSVLVSAGAGSGKTAVLAERVAYLVAEARPPCAVDRLLVVTFTDAAASQMRTRIAAALRARLDERPTDTWLQRQLALIDAAQVSTLHSFCRRVVNRYFMHLDLDPQVPLMDPADAALLAQECARTALDRLGQAETAGGEAIMNLLDSYGSTGDRHLTDRVLQLAQFLASVPDPAEWVGNAVRRFDAPKPGLASFWRGQLLDALRSELSTQIVTTKTYVASLGAGGAIVGGHVKYIQTYQSALKSWLAIVQGDPEDAAIDELCAKQLATFKLPRAPSKTKKLAELPEKDQQAFASAAALVRETKDALFEKRLKRPFGRFSLSDWAEGIERTRPHVEAFLSLVQAAGGEYQSAKRRLGVMDFSDLERATLALLRDDENGVAVRLRSQFDHVLVDEFQDVNPVQAEILRRVSREFDPRVAGNLFGVGDVKQSIYRFRLAEPRLFLDRRAAFADTTGEPSQASAGLNLPLTENFRSSARVIDAINAVFERLMSPDLGGITYDQDTRLKSGRREDSPIADAPLELHLLDDVSSDDDHASEDADATDATDWPRIEREAYVLAERIKAFRRQGVAYRDMVILLRSMQTRAALLLRTLTRLGIPAHAQAAGGFFEALEVQDILSLLAVLDNQQQDIPLASILRSSLFGEPLTDSQLVEIRMACPADSPAEPFHRAAAVYAQCGPDKALRSRLSQIAGRLDEWRQRVRRRPLADVLWEIYHQSGYLAFVGGLADGAQRRANLLRLHEYARKFGTFSRQGLYRFLRFMDGLRDAGQELEPGAVVESAEDCVRLMTIHRSKGLEFPIVFLAECGKRFNLRDASGPILFDRNLGLALEAVNLERRISYPTLPHRLISRAITNETLAEEMRLLYVALTRARDRLVLVGTRGLDKLHDWRKRFRGRQGPLTLTDRQTANCLLDWIGPAICCREGQDVRFLGDDEAEDHAALFAVHTHGPDQMRDWAIDPPAKQSVTEVLERCARLEPLPTATRTATRKDWLNTINRRLTTPYGAGRLTRVPAVAAASSLKRRWLAASDPDEPIAAWPLAGRSPDDAPMAADHFRLPDSISPTDEVDPTSRGTWNHEYLQRIDLARPCTAADLDEQLQSFVSSAAFTHDQAAMIDLEAIGWFFQTPLGVRLRSPAARVLREWPFVIGIDPRRYNPAAKPLGPEDLMLVRGIIDCLFPASPGWEIIDYKTDGVSSEGAAARAVEYRGQLDIYTTAVEAIWGTKVLARHLVFLSPRLIVQV